MRKTRFTAGTVIVAAAILALPTAVGLARVPAYRIQTPLQMFELGTEFLALLFPLLAGLVATQRISGEVAHGFICSVRSRAWLPHYLLVRVMRAALGAFLVFFVAIFVWFLITFALDPLLGISSDPGNTYSSAQGSLQATLNASTFTSLIGVSPWVYGLFYSAWVGLWAAVWATFTAMLLLTVPNRIFAYASPLVLFWADNIVLANLGVPAMRSTQSAFPFGMTAQSEIAALVPLMFWVLVSLVLWLRLRVVKFETDSLT